MAVAGCHGCADRLRLVHVTAPRPDRHARHAAGRPGGRLRLLGSPHASARRAGGPRRPVREGDDDGPADAAGTHVALQRSVSGRARRARQHRLPRGRSRDHARRGVQGPGISHRRVRRRLRARLALGHIAGLRRVFRRLRSLGGRRALGWTRFSVLATRWSTGPSRGWDRPTRAPSSRGCISTMRTRSLPGAAGSGGAAFRGRATALTTPRWPSSISRSAASSKRCAPLGRSTTRSSSSSPTTANSSASTASRRTGSSSTTPPCRFPSSWPDPASSRAWSPTRCASWT